MDEGEKAAAEEELGGPERKGQPWGARQLDEVPLFRRYVNVALAI